jgi:hypothetical protein
MTTRSLADEIKTARLVIEHQADPAPVAIRISGILYRTQVRGRAPILDALEFCVARAKEGKKPEARDYLTKALSLMTGEAQKKPVGGPR